MSQLLLFLSLFLHGVTFFIVFLLYQKLQRVNEGERHFEQRVQETEDLFNSYLLEIKDENKKFIDTISKVDHTSSVPKQNTEHENKTKSLNQSADEPIAFPNYESTKSNQTSFQPETLKVNDRKEQPSIQTQVMHLYEKGYTIEDIAKKLNKGNTEIELIVKFNQKMHN